jgi:FkbM family methyltransferase
MAMETNSPVTIAARTIPLSWRLLSRAVGAYPAVRGQTRLRHITAPWLVAKIGSNGWIRATGLVDAEWDLLSGKHKEEHTTVFVQSFLKPGMTVVDVGANIGYMSVLAALHVGPSGRVLAFEPTPNVADRLRENVRLNGLHNVTTVAAAISDQSGKAHLFQSSDDPEANSLFDDATMNGAVEVEMVTLDSELARRSIEHVDLLKIDAEGAELSVLRGARGLLSSKDRPAILLELNPVTLHRAGVERDQVLQLLAEFGYEWEEIEQFSWQGAIVSNIFARHAMNRPRQEVDRI